MAEQTTNYKLTKPTENNYYNIQDFNDNMDIIDIEIKEAQDKAEKAFQSASDGKQKIATAITGKGVPTGSGDTFQRMADNIGSIETDKTGDATAVAGDILQGKTAYAKRNKLTGTMLNNGSKTFTPTDATQTSGAGYYSGITVNPRPALSGNAAENNVLEGMTFYNNEYAKKTGTMPNKGAVDYSLPINGSYTIPWGHHNGSGKVTQSIPAKAAQTYTPGTANQTIAAGQYLNGAQTIKGDANLIPSNVLSGKSIFGVAGNVVAGKRFASGTANISSDRMRFERKTGSTGSAYCITVSGLNFKPSFILFRAYYKDDMSYVQSTIYTGDFYYGDICCTSVNRDRSDIIFEGTEVFKANAQDGYVSSSGFRIPTRNFSNWPEGMWIAFE